MKTIVFTLFLMITSFVYPNCIEKNTEFYNNGNLKTKVIKYQFLSEVIHFYENGKIQEIGFFDVDGNKTGHWLYYYENGNLMTEASFKNNKKSGKWKTYNQKGKVIVYMKYKRGKRIEGFFWTETDGLVIK